MSTERPEPDVDALEDSDDTQAFDAAMAEEGENLPWEQALIELGWSHPKT